MTLIRLAFVLAELDACLFKGIAQLMKLVDFHGVGRHLSVALVNLSKGEVLIAKSEHRSPRSLHGSASCLRH